MRNENSPSPSIDGVITRATNNAQISQPSTNSESQQQVELSQGFIIEEVIRRLQEILDQKPKQTSWQRFLTHPLTLLIAGLVLSGFVGTGITYVYSTKQ